MFTVITVFSKVSECSESFFLVLRECSQCQSVWSVHKLLNSVKTSPLHSYCALCAFFVCIFWGY